MASNEAIYSYKVSAQYGDQPIEVLLDLDGLTLKECNKVTRASLGFILTMSEISDAVVDGEMPNPGSGGSKATGVSMGEIRKAGAVFATQRNEWPNLEASEWALIRGVFLGSVHGGVDKATRGKAKGKKK